MEKTVTFTMTENQVKKFEKLLDEFNNTVKQTTNRNGKKAAVAKTETSILLSQAKKELRKIKLINSNSKKMIWEQ